MQADSSVLALEFREMPAARCLFAPLFLTVGLLAYASMSSAKDGAPDRNFTPREAEGGRLFYDHGIPIAVFSGTPEEIGRQHGALLGKPGQVVAAFPKRMAAEFGVTTLWPLAVQMGRAIWLNAPTPQQAELAAIAARSKLDPVDLAVGNTLLELRRLGCSALIVEPAHSATGAPIVGRNFDFPTLGKLDKYSLLLVYRPKTGHAFASIAFPTAVGVVSGMNDAGLTLATLDVEATADGSPMFNPLGTPLACVFRRILEECTTVAEAEKLLRGEKRTTCMNLVVCDRQQGAAFEITPKTVARRDAGEGGVVACTNHFVTKGLTVNEECWRYPILEAASQAPALDVEAVHKRLDQVNQGEFTLQTMIFEPRDLVLHLAFGKPPVSDDPLTRIELKPLFVDQK